MSAISEKNLPTSDELKGAVIKLKAILEHPNQAVRQSGLVEAKAWWTMVTNKTTAPAQLFDGLAEAKTVPLLIKTAQTRGVFDKPYDPNNSGDIALWFLTDISGGSNESSIAVIDNGFIPLGVDLLKTKDAWRYTTTLWIFANLAGTPCVRDRLILAGVLDKILSSLVFLDQNARNRMSQWVEAARCLDNFVRISCPTWPFIQGLARRAIQTANLCVAQYRSGPKGDRKGDMKDVVAVLQSCLEAVNSILQSDDARNINGMVDAGVIPLLIEVLSLMYPPSLRIIKVALLSVTRITGCDNPSHSVRLVKNGLIPILHGILEKCVPNQGVANNTWTIRHILIALQNLACMEQTICQVITSGLVFPTPRSLITDLIMDSKQHNEIREEATYVLMACCNIDYTKSAYAFAMVKRCSGALFDFLTALQMDMTQGKAKPELLAAVTKTLEVIEKVCEEKPLMPDVAMTDAMTDMNLSDGKNHPPA